MNKKTIEILGINFINKNFQDMLKLITDRIKNRQKTFIVTANPEIVMFANNNRHYFHVIDSADYIVPDGIGIIVASKILKKPLHERIAGYDLMMDLLHLSNKNGWSIYLLGGEQEVNDNAVKKIREEFPNAVLKGSHHGYFDLDDESVRDEIVRLKPDIVFVALGFPRQEEWIGKNLETFEKGVFIGVGGSIDVLSGRIKRAPIIWQKMNLEWLYRLLKQPSRWKRMLALPIFIITVVRNRFSKFGS